MASEPFLTTNRCFIRRLSLTTTSDALKREIIGTDRDSNDGSFRRTQNDSVEWLWEFHINGRRENHVELALDFYERRLSKKDCHHHRHLLKKSEIIWTTTSIIGHKNRLKILENQSITPRIFPTIKFYIFP